LLTEVRLPAALAKVKGDLFSGCTSLYEIEIPGASAEWASNQLKGCTSLKKIVIAEGPTTIEISKAIFGDAGIPESLEEVVLNRQIGTKYGDVATQTFRGAKGLTTLTVGGSCTSLASSAFESCAALKNVTIPETVTSLGTNVFAGSGIEEIVLPNSITSVTASLFQSCKSLKKVTLGNAVTSIADMAFYNSTVAEVNFPETLKSIGQMAFSGTKLSGALELPEGLTSVGIQAFANNTGLPEVSFPASTTKLGDGAFMGCTGIAKYAVNAANEALKTDATGAMLTVADNLLYAFAPASSVTAITGDFEVVAPYAAYKAAGVTEVTLPKCTNWGDYAFSGTSIKTLAVAGTVGRYVAANCPELTKLVIDGPEVPFGIAANDPALTEVSLSEKLATVKQDAFLNCTSLKELNLGTILAILEADCFKGAALETLTVAAANPAGMAQGVFTADNAALTVKVPVDYVDAYKNAAGWQFLNIVGDANIAAGPSDMGMPAGLYYAHPDGTLRARYQLDPEVEDTYDVGGVEHTFQLAEFKNRIYGASAGKKFVYSATGSVDGDGKLFYISQVGGQTFQAVVLDNAGGNAYQDPFALYIYGDTLYVNDRNVCIRKIAADAIALPKDYPSW
ncbi:MAG: leucine-rich repeat domain-containing protein, partial [Muribaculaceae bacterium]|nr:leucine-rich repeat domain-containing protein [Muribaculaceae bacterium]